MKKIIPFLILVLVFFASCGNKDDVYRFEEESKLFGIPTELYSVYVEGMGGWSPYHIPAEHQTVNGLINKLKIVAAEMQYHIGDVLDTKGDNKDLDLNVRTFMKDVVSKKGDICFIIVQMVDSPGYPTKPDYQVVINSNIDAGVRTCGFLIQPN